jgi:hypothetical protein
MAYSVNKKGQLVVTNSNTGMQHQIHSIKETTNGEIFFSMF